MRTHAGCAFALPAGSIPSVAANRLDGFCKDELYRPLRSTEANRSRRFCRGTRTCVKRMAPLSTPLSPTWSGMMFSPPSAPPVRNNHRSAEHQRQAKTRGSGQTLYPQSCISTPAMSSPESLRSCVMMACTPWSSRPPLPSDFGTCNQQRRERRCCPWSSMRAAAPPLRLNVSHLTRNRRMHMHAQ